MKTVACLAITLGLMALGPAHASAAPKNALDFKMTNLQGQEVDLSSYLGKVVLMVNVASKCGYTPQYEGLQALHKKYGEQGLVVIGFPCNNFGGQEPGSAKEIQAFCRENYGVTFPMMSKIDVQGDKQAPLYAYLTSDKEHGGGIRWNFEKFLVDRQGNVVGHFRSGVKPDSEELTKAIEAELKKK